MVERGGPLDKALVYTSELCNSVSRLGSWEQGCLVSVGEWLYREDGYRLAMVPCKQMVS